MAPAYDLPTDLVETLMDVCKTSEKNFYQASEQARNRGLKVLLKTYAQQRLRYGEELHHLAFSQDTQSVPEKQEAISLNQGWTNLKASLTIQRQNRQILVLRQLLQEETLAIQKYADALNNPLPSSVAEVISRQLRAIQTVHRRIARLTENSDRRLIVRLYSSSAKASQVVERLQAAGLSADDIDQTAVEDVATYALDQPQRQKTKSATVLTSILLGAGFGAVVGAFVGLAQRLFVPSLGGFLANNAVGAFVELLLAGILIGGFFGLIFGLLIGTDTAEDDEFVYTDSLQRGDILVAVFTDTGHAAQVKRIMGLQDEYEIEPVVA